MNKENKKKTLSGKTINVPILNIRMMTDDEWNRLAYRNMLERQAMKNVKVQTVH